jgi:hypothetical protein
VTVVGPDLGFGWQFAAVAPLLLAWVVGFLFAAARVRIRRGRVVGAFAAGTACMAVSIAVTLALPHIADALWHQVPDLLFDAVLVGCALVAGVTHAAAHGLAILVLLTPRGEATTTDGEVPGWA